MHDASEGFLEHLFGMWEQFLFSSTAVDLQQEEYLFTVHASMFSTFLLQRASVCCGESRLQLSTGALVRYFH